MPCGCIFAASGSTLTVTKAKEAYEEAQKLPSGDPRISAARKDYECHGYSSQAIGGQLRIWSKVSATADSIVLHSSSDQLELELELVPRDHEPPDELEDEFELEFELE